MPSVGQLQQSVGQLQQADFFDNVGGLNLVDSPMKIKDSQASGGLNYNYTQTGGFQKRSGHEKTNTSADAQVKSLGLSVHNTATGTKTVTRAAGTALQAIDVVAQTFTNLTQDTTAATASFLTSTTQPVVWSQFNTTLANILWAAGGGMSGIFGVYSATKATANGVATPTGALTTLVTTTDGGLFAATGSYFYAVAFRKTSTQALSNVALDIVGTIAATTSSVTVTLTGITNIDTTLYDKIYIYRSAVGGVTAFTTGDLIAQLDPSTTTYKDLGAYITTASNIARAGNTVLDNSVLTTGTYTTVTTFKRRLVTALSSTVYLSDVNKPESWPTGNAITIPSGGPITGLAIVSFTSPQADSLDEILCIFKERELWVITGASLSDWVLKQIDVVGCPNQSLIVYGNGYLSWIDYRGVYLWDGSGKPIYCSRPIESLFARGGDLDKSKLSYGVGQFYRKENSIVWFLSHRVYGEQQFSLKLDLRLTLPAIEQNLTGRVLDGVFIQDNTPLAVYAANSYLPATTADEILLLGDASGFLYKAFTSNSDGGAAYSFMYATRHLDMGTPGVAKRYHKVIAWVTELGAWNLNLDYWTDYRSLTSQRSTLSEPISTVTGAALWDLATWNQSFWDDAGNQLKPLVFNLNAGLMNSNEGDCLRLQFRNETADQPVIISGFSVIYSEKAVNK